MDVADKLVSSHLVFYSLMRSPSRTSQALWLVLFHSCKAFSCSVSDKARIRCLMRPSQYTAMLIGVLDQSDWSIRPEQVLDMGVGSGVCLAALAARFDSMLWGVDINPLCLQVARENLVSHAQDRQIELLEGNLWEPVPRHAKFGFVTANLPHFPGKPIDDSRLEGWTGGQGRSMMDQFLKGLAFHLDDDGVALITHHDLIGLEHTQSLLSELSLSCQERLRWTVFEPEQRMASLSDAALVDRCESYRCHAGYSFVDSRILEVRRI